jgi:hypothetical protein
MHLCWLYYIKNMRRFSAIFGCGESHSLGCSAKNDAYFLHIQHYRCAHF